jgi:hemoglobin
MNDHRSIPKDTDYVDFDGVKFHFHEVRAVVQNFYSTVAVDPLLKVPFASVHDWPHHIERLTHFWWVRLGGEPYLEGRYNPVEKHFLAGFNPTFLKQWLTLFEITLSKLLPPEKAALWLDLATNMGRALTHKNELYSNQMKNRIL